jgi:hypothetical protein
MFEIPKLAVILLIAFLVWYALRWVNGAAAPKARPRRRGPMPPPPPGRGQPGPAPAIEDLALCRSCGAYVAASAGGCGKPGCPQPR